MPLHDDYTAIREGAAMGSISPRAQLAVTGSDRAAYLQGLLTNDIQALAAGTGCYAAWLTPQGRMFTDMHVLESGGMILLDVPSQQAAATLERLEQFIFTEDVRVGSMAETLGGIWVHGPLAAQTIEKVLDGAQDLSEWALYRHRQFDFRGEAVSVARIDQLGVPGYCLYVDRARAPMLIEALERAGAVSAAAPALEAARIEAGYPVFGTDMTETTIPLEADIEQRAISFSKGCYVGQEVIIRVLHRGGGRVAKKLVGLRFSEEVAAGAKLFAGDREIGEVTSAAESPRIGHIGLGYVHRDFTPRDTHLEVALPHGRVSAIVSERPMSSAA
jgi:folate-binding protein YgfZ